MSEEKKVKSLDKFVEELELAFDKLTEYQDKFSKQIEQIKAEAVGSGQSQEVVDSIVSGIAKQRIYKKVFADK